MRLLPMIALLVTAAAGALFACRPPTDPPGARDGADASAPPLAASSVGAKVESSASVSPVAEAKPVASTVEPTTPVAQREPANVSPNISAAECAAARRGAESAFAAALKDAPTKCKSDADCALVKGNCGVCGGLVGIDKTHARTVESSTGKAHDACSVYWSGPCVQALPRAIATCAPSAPLCNDGRCTAGYPRQYDKHGTP